MSAYGASAGVPGDVPAEPDRAWIMLRGLADQHAGYFTARSVLRAGCADRIPAAIADGRVVRVALGILRMTDWPDGPLDEYAMWSAWFDGAAAVSHHSAAELHGLGRLCPRFLHLSASSGRPPGIPRLVVLRRALRRPDVESAGPFMVTTPVRTVLDLAEAGIGQGSLDEVVADAIAIHRCVPEEIRSGSSSLPPHAAARVRRSLSAA